MASQKAHNHIYHLVESVLRPCLALSCILLLPIVIGGNSTIPQTFSEAFNQNYSIATVSTIASIPLLAFPLMFVKRREIQNKRVNLTKPVFFSAILGAAMSIAGLNSFLWSKSAVLAATFFFSGILAFALNWKDFKRMNEESIKLNKKK